MFLNTVEKNKFKINFKKNLIILLKKLPYNIYCIGKLTKR